MHLRPQLGNLFQVNQTLAQNVPLASQRILMPVRAVAVVQQEGLSAQAAGVHVDAVQVKNLALRDNRLSLKLHPERCSPVGPPPGPCCLLHAVRAPAGQTQTLAAKCKEEGDGVSTLGSVLLPGLL